MQKGRPWREYPICHRIAMQVGSTFMHEVGKTAKSHSRGITECSGVMPGNFMCFGDDMDKPAQPESNAC